MASTMIRVLFFSLLFLLPILAEITKHTFMYIYMYINTCIFLIVNKQEKNISFFVINKKKVFEEVE